MYKLTGKLNLKGRMVSKTLDDFEFIPGVNVARDINGGNATSSDSYLPGSYEPSKMINGFYATPTEYLNRCFFWFGAGIYTSDESLREKWAQIDFNDNYLIGQIRVDHREDPRDVYTAEYKLIFSDQSEQIISMPVPNTGDLYIVDIKPVRTNYVRIIPWSRHDDSPVTYMGIAEMEIYAHAE